MKNFFKACIAPLFGIITCAVIIGFSMAACDDGNGDDGDGGTGIKAPGVGQLPAFPPGSTSPVTKADAETILAELRQSTVIESLNDEIEEVIEEYQPDNFNSYNFSNRSLLNGQVKVNFSYTANETNTGGFKALEDNRKAISDLYDALWDLYDDYANNAAEIAQLQGEIDLLEDARDGIQFARNNKSSVTYTQNRKGEVTRAATENGVTIAQGSTFEMQSSGSGNQTVTTAGTYETFRENYTVRQKQQAVEAFTVTTSSGSVKIILDASMEGNESRNNVLYYGDDGVGTRTQTMTYSGSLKVYGDNNALLIDHRIVDEASFNLAGLMISYDPYPFDPSGAAALTANTITNGNITSSGTVDWYAINVSNGTKYHLWWDDEDTNYSHMDVTVRGYTSDGSLFFDVDRDWSLDWPNYYSFTATSPGTVYIMVYSRYGDTGTYDIVFNTTGSQPSSMIRAVSPAAPVSPFGAAPARPEHKAKTAARPIKPIESIRLNRRGFLFNK